MRVGFIGLGRMGAAMAMNLVTAGHTVTVFNRSSGKDEALVAAGARRAGILGDACQAEAVITMLADDAAVEASSLGPGGIADAMAPGAIHVSMSTISVALSERLLAAHAAKGQRYVAAPVFGRPDAAAARKLFIAAAGAPDALADCAPLFEAMGQRSFMLGEHPPAANLVKLSGNFLIAATIEALGEAMALVGKAGVDRHAYLDLLTSTLFSAPVHKTYGALIAEGHFSPAGFTSLLGLKDMRLTLAAADALRVPLPLGSLLRDRFLALLARGGEALDWSAIAALAAADAGLETLPE